MMTAEKSYMLSMETAQPTGLKCGFTSDAGRVAAVGLIGGLSHHGWARSDATVTISKRRL